MNNVSVIEKHEISAQSQAVDTGALIAVIERAATNPDVDIDKMERLMAMYERIGDQKAEAAFNDAMSEAQGRMRPISADANNPQTRSKYATYAKLDSSLRPIYTDCGFSLSFDTGEATKPEDVRVLCYVSHRAGYKRTYKVDMPADGKGAKGGDVMTKTHAMGAGMSYGMRYLLKMIFNVAVGEDDTDGNAPAQQAATISADQAAQLRAAAKVAGVDDAYICKKARVREIGQIQANRFDAAHNHLKKLAMEGKTDASN